VSTVTFWGLKKWQRPIRFEKRNIGTQHRLQRHRDGSGRALSFPLKPRKITLFLLLKARKITVFLLLKARKITVFLPLQGGG